MTIRKFEQRYLKNIHEMKEWSAAVFSRARKLIAEGSVFFFPTPDSQRRRCAFRLAGRAKPGLPKLMELESQAGFLKLGDDFVSITEVKILTGNGSDLEMTVTFASRTQPLTRLTPRP
jgi:hypothetical protein